MQPEGKVCVALAWLLYCRIGFQDRLPTIFLITTSLLCSKPFSNLPGIEKRQSPEEGFTVPLGGPSLSFNFFYQVTTGPLQLQPCHTPLLHFGTLPLLTLSPFLFLFITCGLVKCLLFCETFSGTQGGIDRSPLCFLMELC